MINGLHLEISFAYWKSQYFSFYESLEDGEKFVNVIIQGHVECVCSMRYV